MCFSVVIHIRCRTQKEIRKISGLTSAISFSRMSPLTPISNLIERKPFLCQDSTFQFVVYIFTMISILFRWGSVIFNVQVNVLDEPEGDKKCHRAKHQEEYEADQDGPSQKLCCLDST